MPRSKSVCLLRIRSGASALDRSKHSISRSSTLISNRLHLRYGRMFLFAVGRPRSALLCIRQRPGIPTVSCCRRIQQRLSMMSASVAPVFMVTVQRMFCRVMQAWSFQQQPRRSARDCSGRYPMTNAQSRYHYQHSAKGATRLSA